MSETRIRKLVRRASVVGVIAAGLVIGTGGFASASSDQKVDLTIQFAEVQFTNCPTSLPSQDVHCIGTDVRANSFDSVVGDIHRHASRLDVALFNVVLHPDGTFKVQPQPFATGGGPATFSMDGFDVARIAGSVPMSDGTRAKVAARLFGNNPVSHQDTDFVAPVSDCPSGAAQVTGLARQRNAFASGAATIHGEDQPPTSVVAQPFMALEIDHGFCTA
jgi:hypothetical protein